MSERPNTTTVGSTIDGRITRISRAERVRHPDGRVVWVASDDEPVPGDPYGIGDTATDALRDLDRAREFCAPSATLEGDWE